MGIGLRYSHHVGHIVHDMNAALDLYRRLGFDCAPPAYPLIAPTEGASPQPFGVANAHVPFVRNFIELVTIISDDVPIPADAVLVPLHIPAAVLPRMRETMLRTVATLAAGLARFAGIHILVFQTDDVAAAAVRLDRDGVAHSGVINAQRQIETTAGLHVAPVQVLEIDQEPVLEGRLAIADNPSPEILCAQTHMNHPNGAIDLVEIVLCVANSDVDATLQRYQHYLERAPHADAMAHVFTLHNSRITIVAASNFDTLCQPCCCACLDRIRVPACGRRSSTALCQPGPCEESIKSCCPCSLGKRVGAVGADFCDTGILRARMPLHQEVTNA